MRTGARTILYDLMLKGENSMFKRIISLTMCAVILLLSVSIIGCKDTENENTESEITESEITESEITESEITESENETESKNGSESEQTSEDEAEETSKVDTYVAPDVNYNDKDFNIMTWTWCEDWVLSVDERSSAIESQTYYHLKNVERELGIKFKIALEQAGHYGYHGSFINKVQTLSGADNIDLVSQYSLAASIGAQNGLYANLIDLEYINWDAEYWSDSLYDFNAVNGKMYYCTGDLTGTSVRNMFIMLYNYDMVNENHMGNLYDLVDKGEWTIEKLKQLSSKVYMDDNDDKLRNVGDTFGLVLGEYLLIDAFQAGAGLSSIVNQNGKLSINSEMNGDYGISVIHKLEALLHENDGAYCPNKPDNSDHRPNYGDAFVKGKAVFEVNMCEGILTTVSRSDINYGILPMPKYDEDQEGYYTCLNMTYNMYSVLAIARDKEMSGAVLESLAHSGNKTLIPTINEALRYKYSQRTEDIRMLELIKNGIVYDPGRLFDQMGIFSFVRSTVRDNISPVSAWEGRSPAYYQNIDSINEIFK